VRTIAFLGIVIAALEASGQAPRSSYDPAASRPAKQHDSFTDFALKKINPQNIDYGQSIEEMRRTAILATMDDYYYWSNLVTIGGLAIMFCFFFRQHVLLKRRALSTARVISWYHNELAEARAQAFAEGAKYLHLKRLTDDQIEASLAQKTQPPKPATVSREQSGRSSSNVNGTVRDPQSQGEPSFEEALKKMEHQAVRDKELIDSLRQQITVLSRRIQADKGKSRGIEGE
jgi:hypothetical protein